jgi:RNA 3'-terminal phosphate cyclase-like protein
MSTTQPALRFTGHQFLAQRLILSTLTGRAVHISQIRPSSPSSPGLAPHEISLLRLLEAVTNGAHIEISYTGTILLYKPGLISGSAAESSVVRHEIVGACSRGVSYFLIPLALLAPFSKAPFNVLFTGPGVITSSTPSGDMSVDSVRTAILPLYAKFGIDRNIELRILQRSNVGTRGKGGAGEVQLIFGHQIRLPKTLHFMNGGRVKRIRGVAYSTGVSGSSNARMIEAARAILNPFSADTYIFSDISSAALVPAKGKNNPAAKKKIGLGFGISLVAESSTGALYCADAASPPSGGQPPEDIGQQCAYQLLESISRGGCASLEAAPTMITLMAMGSEDVGRIQLGKEVLGNEHIIQLARDLSRFGAAGWAIRDPGDEKSEDEAIVSIVGRGIGNVGRKIG